MNTISFTDEETVTRLGYHSGYGRTKFVSEQRNIISNLFPDTGLSDEDLRKQFELLSIKTSPKETRDWFYIPRWNTLGITYAQALARILQKFKEITNGTFANFLDGFDKPPFLKQGDAKQDALELMFEKQGRSKCLLFTAQFGIGRRGQNAETMSETMNENEFPLGAYEAGVMLLTHPERLKSEKDLWINCPGDKFDPNGEGNFSQSPYYRFSNGRIELSSRSRFVASVNCGSVTGFIS